MLVEVINLGKIISIHSFRGGTGKSNITANLATATALHGGARVGVIDTDIQSPGVHVIFGLGGKKLQHPLNEYLQGKCKIEDTAVDVTKSLKLDKGEVYMFPAALEANEITKILREGYEVSMLSEGFNQIVDNMKLDYLFIDTHPGLNEETFLSIAISDCLLVIMRPDQQDYLGTSVTLEIAKKLEVPNIYLIVNKLLEKFDEKSVKGEVEKKYKIKVAEVLRFYEELAETASNEVFITSHKDHELATKFRNIYDIISRIWSPWPIMAKELPEKILMQKLTGLQAVYSELADDFQALINQEQLDSGTKDKIEEMQQKFIQIRGTISSIVNYFDSILQIEPRKQVLSMNILDTLNISDSFRKTMMAVIRFGKADAAKVSSRTKRVETIEEENLSALEQMGFLSAEVKDGRKVYSVALGKRKAKISDDLWKRIISDRAEMIDFVCLMEVEKAELKKMDLDEMKKMVSGIDEDLEVVKSSLDKYINSLKELQSRYK